jgi:hypothetical protein
MRGMGMRSIYGLLAGFGVLGILMIIGIWVASIVGWIMNICKLCGCSFEHFNAEVVVRGIGVFMAPLGAIMGYVPHSWFN